MFGGYLFVVRDTCRSKDATEFVTHSIVTTSPSVLVARNEVIAKGVTSFTTSRVDPS